MNETETEIEEASVCDTQTSSSEDDESIVEISWTEQEELDCIETLLELMYEYIDENVSAIAEPDFEDVMVHSVKELYQDMNPYSNQMNAVYAFFDAAGRSDLDQAKKHWDAHIDCALDSALDLLYNTLIPPRSYASSFVSKKMTNEKNDEEHAAITKKIIGLQGLPQPVQRTAEWYTFRHNLITASNAFKAFESQATQNQLIYEKCLPCKLVDAGPVSVDSTLHYGQKYEPLSVMYYEHTYKTSVIELGCIVHPHYSFLGASPDGINFEPDYDPDHDPTKLTRHGRMLEIKNIVNREINGIPKKEYWIQMQLQMETCDLESCDFLETRFVEYVDETEFLADGDDDGLFVSRDGYTKGVIMYFADKEGRPVYKYKPWAMNDVTEYEEWYETTLQTMTETAGYTWVSNLYWKLEEVSCVLVLRNRKWFADNIGQLQRIWSIIEQERVSGYEHRAPKRRSGCSGDTLKVIKLGISGASSGGCLININGKPLSYISPSLDSDTKKQEEESVS